MALFKKLMGLVLEEEPKVTSPQAATPPVAASSAPVSASPATPLSGEVVSEMIDKLRDEVDERSPAVYEAFMTNVTALADAIPDKIKRYKGALATAKVGDQQVTFVSLTQAIEKRLTLVDSEEADFSEEMDLMYQREVVSREQELTKISSEMEGLQRQMTALEERKKVVSQEKFEADQKIGTGRARFAAAAKALRSEIQAELDDVLKIGAPATGSSATNQ